MVTKKKPPSDPDKAPPDAQITAPPLQVAPLAVLQAPSSYAGITFKPAVYDPEVARAMLDALRPHLDAFVDADVLVPRLDVRAAALAALAVHAFITQTPALKARFQKLHDIGEFDIQNLALLKDVAFVVLYAYAEAETAGAFATGASVPAALVKAGIEVEGRMQDLCEYKFKRDPDIAPKLALLRPGTGHEDLASDLLGYAAIYAERPAEVASDTTNYRPTDLAEARQIAGEIFAHLASAMSPSARDTYDTLQRAWTLLLQIYVEVQEVGRALLRYDAQREERFPSLYTVGRSSRPRKKKPEAAELGEAPGAGEPTPAGK